MQSTSNGKKHVKEQNYAMTFSSIIKLMPGNRNRKKNLNLGKKGTIYHVRKRDLIQISFVQATFEIRVQWR